MITMAAEWSLLTKGEPPFFDGLGPPRTRTFYTKAGLEPSTLKQGAQLRGSLTLGKRRSGSYTAPCVAIGQGGA
jgi:hypothetical protein